MNQKSPKLASVEADLAGSLFGFFTKTIALLRESSLDDDQAGKDGDGAGWEELKLGGLQ